MPVPICVVDSFTDTAFSGNPAAVCVLDRPAPETWMRSVASETNLAATAFAAPRADGDHDLRWFTPAAEIDLCGHGTLATAHVLGCAARFHTRGGVLTCEPGRDGTIEMNFPVLRPELCATPDGLAEALRTTDIELTATSKFDHLVVLVSAKTVRALEPDHRALIPFGGRGFIVTARGDRDGIDCLSRYFAPAFGIDEDPVTGSAHCVLAPFWAERIGRSELVGEQASRRGGIVRMHLDGERVTLAGRAVTVWEGTLHADP
jgi:predicted PhzF superfamily epimerase YddE/YHI9